MKQWIEDVLTLCARSGPQTSVQLAAFVTRCNREQFEAAQARDPGTKYVYSGKPERKELVVTKLRKQPQVVVEVVASTPSRARGAKNGERRRKLYMVSRRVEQAAGQS
jgi:hypothetical protein